VKTGKPVVVLARRLKAKKEFRLFRFGANPSTKGVFKLSKESAAELMETYQRRALKVTFDYDHFALKGTSPQDGKSAGKCDLELRDDGIYCTNIEWTPAAREEIEDGEWVYFSPAFETDTKTQEIVELINVALTNIPAMDAIETVAANRRTREAQTMKHQIADHLASYLKGGKSFADLSKACGIHADRLKALHDGDGDAPAQEELKALGKHMSLSPESMKAMGVAEGPPVKASAVDGQDVDKTEGDGDDEVEHEDLEGAKPNMLRRNSEVAKMLTVLTGTSDSTKQMARLKAMRVKSDQYDEDHETVVALKQEREAEKLNLLIEKGKAEGKLTPGTAKYWLSRSYDEFEEFLSVAPVVLNTRSVVEVKTKDGKETAMLSREQEEVARHCGIDNEEMVEAIKMTDQDQAAEVRKQRAKMMKMFKDQDRDPVLGVVATRKQTGLRT